MSLLFQAYPFLEEDYGMCDYEIASDELASYIALTTHYVSCKEHLGKIVELVYHANGSVRGRNAISDEDITWLVKVYEYYQNEVGEMKHFVLPQGSEGACMLHILRSRCKAMVRILHVIKKEHKVEDNVWNLYQLLSNLFFLMAVYENKIQGVKEVEFKSKSYGKY